MPADQRFRTMPRYFEPELSNSEFSDSELEEFDGEKIVYDVNVVSPYHKVHFFDNDDVESDYEEDRMYKVKVIKPRKKKREQKRHENAFNQPVPQSPPKIPVKIQKKETPPAKKKKSKKEETTSPTVKELYENDSPIRNTLRTAASIANQIHTSLAKRKSFSNLFNRLSAYNPITLFQSNRLTYFDRSESQATFDSLHKKHSSNTLSIYSFNILAPEYVENSTFYKHCAPKALDWKRRVKMISNELKNNGSDILCLQEVSRKVFSASFQPMLQKNGYIGVLKASKLKLKSAMKESKKFKELPGNAIFFKGASFEKVFEIDSFRTNIIGLKFKYSLAKGQTLIIINVHLEGNPEKHKDRENQIKAALKKVQKCKFEYSYVVVVGDFNTPLSTTNGVSKALLDVSLQSVYNDDTSRDATCIIEPKKKVKPAIRDTSRIDHINYDPAKMEPIGLMRVFDSSWDRDSIFKTGLPNKFWPSDHLSISAAFKLLHTEPIKPKNQP